MKNKSFPNKTCHQTKIHPTTHKLTLLQNDVLSKCNTLLFLLISFPLLHSILRRKQRKRKAVKSCPISHSLPIIILLRLSLDSCVILGEMQRRNIQCPYAWSHLKYIHCFDTHVTRPRHAS